MTADNGNDLEPTIFSAVITPHRSLGRTGFLILMFVFGLITYRHAGAYEEVTVTPSTLTVRKVSHHGRAREWVLNPLWTRLGKDVHEEYGIERLFLVARGKELAIASFLGPDEKANFAEELGAALGEAKRGVTRTTFD